MIRGAVDDPVLTMDNDEIARRHVTAYLLQRYHQDRLPTSTPKSSRNCSRSSARCRGSPTHRRR